MGMDVKGPFFVVLEGIDGSGKGTQIKLLGDYLKKNYSELKIVLTKEPSSGSFGNYIREKIRYKGRINAESLALLFAADRVEHVTRKIFPALKSEKFVVSERYVYSSFAYQGQHVDMDWICDINYYTIVPDLVIYLDVPVKVGWYRVQKKAKKDTLRGLQDKEEFFEKEFVFLEKVRDTFLRIIDDKSFDLKSGKYLNRSTDFKTPTMVKLDGTKSEEEIHEDIKGHVRQLIKGEYPRLTQNLDFKRFDEKSQRALTDFFKRTENRKNNNSNSKQKALTHF